MKRISVFIAEPQYRAFQELASEQGRPYSELIREALSRYLRDHGKPAEKAERKRGATRRRS
jgi:predicted DNA binding CopG/RHH family protein